MLLSLSFPVYFEKKTDSKIEHFFYMFQVLEEQKAPVKESVKEPEVEKIKKETETEELIVNEMEVDDAGK